MNRAERLIRDAKPASGPISARAEADLARILTMTDGHLTSSQWSFSRRSRWTWAAAAALAFILVIAATSLVRPTSATATTPPILPISPMGLDPKSALRELAARSEAQPNLSAETEIVTQWWALASESGPEGNLVSSYVDPRRRVITTGPNGISGYTDYAGQPYDIGGNPVDDPTLPAPGSLLGYMSVDKGERIFSSPPPTNSSSYRRYLTEAVAPYSESPTVAAFDGISSLLSERVLSPAQNAALATYLSTLPDISLQGSSSDRSGRAVLVFAAPMERDYQMVLMVATDTGRVAAIETIYRGAGRADISSPAIVAYTLWEKP